MKIDKSSMDYFLMSIRQMIQEIKAWIKSDVEKDFTPYLTNIPNKKDINNKQRWELILALASNPALIKEDIRILEVDGKKSTEGRFLFPEDSAEMIMQQTDAIMKLYLKLR